LVSERVTYRGGQITAISGGAVTAVSTDHPFGDLARPVAVFARRNLRRASHRTDASVRILTICDDASAAVKRGIQSVGGTLDARLCLKT